MERSKGSYRRKTIREVIALRIPRKALSIDFGSREIKVIEGKYKKGNVQILKADAIEIAPAIYEDGKILNKTELVKQIKYMLDRNKIKTTAAHAVISSTDILTREIIIPGVSQDEIESVVKYQIADNLPINVEDYVVQYLNQGSIFIDETEKIKILLLAIPEDMVLSHMDVLRSAGLKPEILDYQGNSMAKLIGFNNNINQSYDVLDLTIASIDMGYTSSKITITKNGKIEVARVIDFGMKTLTETILSFFEYPPSQVEKQLRTIRSLEIRDDEFSDEARFSNVVRSTLIDFCEKVDTVFRHYNTRETGNAIDCILLQGGVSNINQINKIFSTHFNIQTSQISTLDRINWEGGLCKYANAIGGLVRMDVR